MRMWYRQNIWYYMQTSKRWGERKGIQYNLCTHKNTKCPRYSLFNLYLPELTHWTIWTCVTVHNIYWQPNHKNIVINTNTVYVFSGIVFFFCNRIIARIAHTNLTYSDADWWAPAVLWVVLAGWISLHPSIRAVCIDRFVWSVWAHKNRLPCCTANTPIYVNTTTMDELNCRFGCCAMRDSNANTETVIQIQ